MVTRNDGRLCWKLIYISKKEKEKIYLLFSWIPGVRQHYWPDIRPNSIKYNTRYKRQTPCFMEEMCLWLFSYTARLDCTKEMEGGRRNSRLSGSWGAGGRKMCGVSNESGVGSCARSGTAFSNCESRIRNTHQIKTHQTSAVQLTSILVIYLWIHYIKETQSYRRGMNIHKFIIINPQKWRKKWSLTYLDIKLPFPYWIGLNY